jgi:hypothetical protein
MNRMNHLIIALNEIDEYLNKDEVELQPDILRIVKILLNFCNVKLSESVISE